MMLCFSGGIQRVLMPQRGCWVQVLMKVDPINPAARASDVEVRP